jgi:mutator protein MutT
MAAIFLIQKKWSNKAGFTKASGANESPFDIRLESVNHHAEDQLKETETIDVSAGLVFRAGQLLIAQRRVDSHLGGLWEFPGGKREPGESFEQCLQRELREELGVAVEVGRLFESVTHHYPEKSVHVRFFFCHITAGEPQALGCDAICWVTRTELSGYEFPAADARLLAALARSESLWR